METIFAFGLQGLVAYGFVGLLSLLLSKKGIILPSEVKTYTLVGVAFLVGFVPAELGNVIFERLKEAIAIGLAISAVNTLSKRGN